MQTAPGTEEALPTRVLAQDGKINHFVLLLVTVDRNLTQTSLSRKGHVPGHETKQRTWVGWPWVANSETLDTFFYPEFLLLSVSFWETFFRCQSPRLELTTDERELSFRKVPEASGFDSDTLD